MKPTILWFRNDLRLIDNPALVQAAEAGNPVLPIYIYSPHQAEHQGAASKWWLHHSLQQFSTDLRKTYNLELALFQGEPLEVLSTLLPQTGAQTIMWNRLYDQHSVIRDKQIKDHFKLQGTDVRSFNSHLLHEPWECLKTDGTPYVVFTPYWKHCRALPRHKILSRPEHLEPYSHEFPTDLTTLPLLPTHPWPDKLEPHWQPGEVGAQARLEHFIDQGLQGYKQQRNIPAVDHTSRLSPHLHFGEISPGYVFARVEQEKLLRPEIETDVECFLSELGWREFSYSLLFYNPELAKKPLKPDFSRFPWASDYGEALERWQKGLTGYPLVDAGMRQLWHLGWMHNRVRMIVASFLIKDLMIPWQEGERWFWDTLVDADPASNAASWQWVAGCGADASPFFRIFNPSLQSEKFDPHGDYIRQWVPELSGLSDKSIHTPWAASATELEAAGIVLGETYPNPMVDHKKAREIALAAYKSLKD